MRGSRGCSEGRKEVVRGDSREGSKGSRGGSREGNEEQYNM